MIIKGLIDEDFVNYKKPAMVIEFPYCTFKCDRECGKLICQNSSLVNEPNIDISCENIILRYINNPITKAIVFQGLEPFDSFGEMNNFLLWFQHQFHNQDDIVIYTGYNEDEISQEINILKEIFSNIIIKFGRYIPNQKSHYDKILGVKLASDNQYAKKIC